MHFYGKKFQNNKAATAKVTRLTAKVIVRKIVTSLGNFDSDSISTWHLIFCIDCIFNKPHTG